MFTLTWLKDAAERAVKTFCQALLTLMTLGTAITDVDWGSAAAISATAAVVSVLMSVVSAGVANNGTASLTKAVEASPTELTKHNGHEE